MSCKSILYNNKFGNTLITIQNYLKRKTTNIKKRHICYIAIICTIAVILFLCFNLSLLRNKNIMLKNELDAINAEYSLLADTHSSVSKELESVNYEFEFVQNELESVKKELIEVKKENMQWSSKYNQYPAATIAWIYMTEELGWSDFVAAGILGNMMAECGGQTLKLNWDSDGSSGYGLIQWVGNRYNSIKEKYGETPTVVEQIEFVKDELYGTNGVTKQVTDQQRELILNATSPEKCATEFAIWFERPSHKNYGVRRSNAANAYAYFCDVSDDMNQ